MFTLTTGQLELWLAQIFWPFVRVGSCFMVAPAFGASYVPPRIRLVIAGGVALIIAPLVASPAGIAPFSAPGLVVTVQQAVIGVALGFCMQLVFDAVTLGGQLLANSMGLSFAYNLDPLHGAQTPVVGQFYTLLVTTPTEFAVHRDPIACKPAVIAQTDAYIAMASEYRALTGLPGIKDAKVFEPTGLHTWTR